MDEAEFKGLVKEVKAALSFDNPKYPLACYNQEVYFAVSEKRQDELLHKWIDESQTDEGGDAWDTLNLIGHEFIKLGYPLPFELRHWVMDVLADGTVNEGKRRPRPTPSSIANRQRIIGRCVRQLCRRGLDPTRSTKANVFKHRCCGKNPCTKEKCECNSHCCWAGGSACDVVGVALREMKMSVGYKAVEKDWTNYRKRAGFTLSRRPKK